MKRARIINLALMAVFAVSAVGTSAAFAVSEFKTPGAFPVSFTGKGDGSSTFETQKGNTVTCLKSSSFGKVLGALEALAEVTYSECTLKAKEIIEIKDTCPNILTLPLLLKPVDRLNLVTDKIGVLISAEGGGALAHFTCTGTAEVKVLVLGSLICETQPSFGKFTENGLIGCRQNGLGLQEFKTALNSSGVDTEDFLTADSTSFAGSTTEKDAQITHELVTYAALVLQSL